MQVTPELIISFVFGVISSIIASIILFIFKTDVVIDRAIRLRNRRRNLAPEIDDSHGFIRTQWAFALRDLDSKNQSHVLKAIQSLSHMADLLSTEERDVAYDLLKARCATNKFRDLDSSYLDAMHRLRP